MNPAPLPKPVWHHGVNFVAASLLFIALVAVVRFSVAVPAIDADRAAVRARDLAEIRAAENRVLATPGWVDPDRAIVRLPIEQAMSRYETLAQNPVAARAELLARAGKATAPLPKTAPKPSAFE